MSPCDGSRYSDRTTYKTLSKAQESISDRKVLDSLRIRDEEHCKMGNRQIKICL